MFQQTQFKLKSINIGNCCAAHSLFWLRDIVRWSPLFGRPNGFSSMLILSRVLNTPTSKSCYDAASELEISAEGPLGGDYRVPILEKRLYDETTLFTRPLHLTMSLVQLNDVLLSNFSYLLIWVPIATELLSNEILAANRMAYKLCIMKRNTVN